MRRRPPLSAPVAVSTSVPPLPELRFLPILLFALLLSLLTSLPCIQAQTSWGSTFDATSHFFSSTWESIATYTGFHDFCPFATDFSEVARRAVHSKIRCQDRAVNAITSGLSHWEMDLMKDVHRPLVLAFTGPTGVGKTETAHVIARAMLPKTELVGIGKRPRGLMVLRGEDFADVHANVTSYIDTIKSALFQHLIKCQGHAVVIFDEVQKVVPGTLDALAEAISEHPTLTYYKPEDATIHRVDTSHVAFFLISDIGWEDMLTLLIAHGGSAAALPPHLLSQRVKVALDAQWTRLKFGKLIDKIVPFLPLSQAQMREILDLKLEEMGEEHRGRLWARLETTEGVREYLVKSPFVKYAGYGFEDEEEGGMEEGEEAGNACDSIQGGMCKQAKEVAEDNDEEVGEEKRKRKEKKRRKEKEVYWFAEFGARNLQTGGPLHALESAIVESMKPWRPLEVLDVRYNAQTDETELRWCPTEVRFVGEGGRGGGREVSLLREEGGVTGCELRWAGNLKTKIG